MEQRQIKLYFEPVSILRDVLKNWWMLILAVLIGIMSMYIISWTFCPPVYQSSGSIAVRVKSDTHSTYSTFTYSSKMARIFSNVFVQKTMKEYAAKNIGADSFDGAISANVMSDTNIITVSVLADSPEKAYRLICSVLEVYPEISDTIFDNAVLNVVSTPKVPTEPSSGLSAVRQLALVGLPAFAVLCIIVLLSLLRDTVKAEKDFHNKIETKLLGIVKHAKKHTSVKNFIMKKNTPLLVNSIYTGFEFTGNYQKLATKLDYMRRHNKAKSFAITSVSEGEGKSTASANLAITLAGRGYKVLLLDMDFKKPSLDKMFSVDLSGEADLGDLLSHKTSANNFKLTRFKKINLYLGLNRTAHHDFSDWISDDFTKKILKAFGNIFDFILIDTPPISAAADVTGLMSLADKTILVVRTDYTCTADINDSIYRINKMEIDLAGCILNDVYGEFTLFGQTGYDETGYYGKKYHKYSKYSPYANLTDSIDYTNINSFTETEQQNDE